MTNDRTPPLDPAALPPTPQPRLSPLRVAAAVLGTIVVIGAAALGTRTALTDVAQGDTPKAATWFAPYVDTTLTPDVAFQRRADNPSGNVVLGFVVADPKDACAPSWGGYHSLDAAASALDLDRRVTQIQGEGGQAIVSFGGQANQELAVACTDPRRLAAAYRSVLERYRSTTVDFDVEGSALPDTAANARRATAVAELQRRARADGRRLDVWLTLPVAPDGLRPEGLAAVRGMLAAEVRLTGVNVMAMDFGGAKAASVPMRTAIESSVTATRRQLRALYATAGSALTDAEASRRLGLTVMIGQNDVDAERVSVADARALTAFARRERLGRISMWSLNRDAQCGVTFAMVGTHSNLCSGVRQEPLQFSKVFAALKGSPAPAPRATAAQAAVPPTAMVDDPARSPYPIWSPQQSYREGYKVVWRQAVYRARWYTQGQTPGAPTGAVADDPWTLVGPVLATDRAPEIPKLAPGTHPAWRAGGVYRKGQKVLHRGLPYRAKWYTQGDAPGTFPTDGAPSPWEPLYRIPGEPVDG